jgi:hypothetical protein
MMKMLGCALSIENAVLGQNQVKLIIAAKRIIKTVQGKS